MSSLMASSLCKHCPVGLRRPMSCSSEHESLSVEEIYGDVSGRVRRICSSSPVVLRIYLTVVTM